MNVKPFTPKDATWGFKLEFTHETYQEGQNALEALLGPRKGQDGEWRWFMVQDLPFSMSKRFNYEKLMEGFVVDNRRRKGRLYVNDEQLAVLMKLMVNA